MRLSKSAVLVVALVAGVFVSSRAEAAPVSCPNPLQSGQTNVYTVDTSPDVIDCVWGPGNLNGAGNDQFLDGSGTNDPAYGTAATEAAPNPQRFNMTWNFLGSTNGWSNGPTDAVSGLSFSGSSNTSTNFVINPALAGNYTSYALGIKDGSDPKWAVFLLSSDLSGIASMTGGSFSHFALYGSNSTPTNGGGAGAGGTGGGGQTVPEPASLALFGAAMLGLGYRSRRNR